jgi:hypothetical protein
VDRSFLLEIHIEKKTGFQTLCASGSA